MSELRFRHLGTHRIEGVYGDGRKGPWYVVDTATGKRVAGPYKVYRNAWLRRKAFVYGTTVKRARGLPS